MVFEWDNTKAKANLLEHGVSFYEATTVLYGPLSATGDDLDHSQNESRFVTFGMSALARLLVVGHTNRGRADSYHYGPLGHKGGEKSV